MYHIDTPTLAVAAYDYDADTGDISNRRVAVAIPGTMGMPDGMCVDDEGMLWVALWGGREVTRWDPSTGALLERIGIPALNVSSCAFGGRDRDELYVTTARVGTDTAQYPLAGGLFVLKPGVRGRAGNLFAG
jgi:sugar lactone lactonase YvrE